MNKTTLPRSYMFKVVVEPDDDRWFAYAPALESLGAATWGYTKEEALKNIQDVVRLVVDDLLAEGKELPTQPADAVQISEEPMVSVTV